MRSKTICPKCRGEIPLDDVNVATDLALCRQCGRTWSYADLVENASTVMVVPQNPPAGAWFHETGPNAFEVGVSTRSGLAFFLVPFMCVWSGGSLGAIYGSQIAERQFHWERSLFGLPFLLGTLLFGSVAVMSVCGKTLVRVEGDDGIIFTGVGPIGWKRRFNWRKVSAISRTRGHGSRGSTYEQITLKTEKRLNFASGVKTERLDYLVGVLQKKWRESGH